MNLYLISIKQLLKQPHMQLTAGTWHSQMQTTLVALGRLKAAGVKVMEFDDSIWEAFGKAAKEAQDGFMDDDLFATIRNNYEESMASTYSWMSMSDGVFAQKRDKFKV